MLNKLITKKDKRSDLEKEMASILLTMSKTSPETEEYVTMAKNLETLSEINNKGKSKKISPDTWMMVAGNLAGILIILNFEKADVITSKALSFIIKSKV